jgi:hypothetical protein
MKLTLGENVYELFPLTRGQIKDIVATTDVQDQLDKMVSLSLKKSDIDEIINADFMKIFEAATEFNGTLEKSVDNKKKS